MRSIRWLILTLMLGLCVLGVTLLLRIQWQPQPRRRPPNPARTRLRSRLSPSEAALQEAKQLWGRAQMAIKPELEALAAADPYSTDSEGGRRQRLMAQDRGGYLRRAHEAAHRAAAQANSPKETYEATLWLAIIECDQGQHRAELHHARLLLVFQPQSPEAWGALRHAAKCNDLRRLSRQADKAIRELSGGAPDGPEDRP
jgi:hypothetical protein